MTINLYSYKYTLRIKHPQKWLRHTTHLPILQINFVSQHHEWEVFWVARTGLNEKFVPPAVQCLEGVGGSDVKHQNTAVCTAVKSHTQRLKPLLTCCVPYLENDTELYKQFNCKTLHQFYINSYFNGFQFALL